MSRFLSRKSSKDRSTGDDADRLDATPSKQPRTLQEKLWRRKKEVPQPEPEVEFASDLPSADNFRTSLIMPKLSARFSMLKGLGDSSYSRSYAKDDMALEPKNKSLLGELPELGPILLDIAEEPSTRPSQDIFRGESYTYGQSNYDHNSGGSIMNRGRPVEGNVLFGGRQRVYKVRNVGPAPCRSRTAFGTDASVSAFQILHDKEREVEREWRKAKLRRDLELEDQADDEMEMPSLSSLKRNRVTASSTNSDPSRVSGETAATSITGHSSPVAPTSPLRMHHDQPPRFALHPSTSKTQREKMVPDLCETQTSTSASSDASRRDESATNKHENVDALAQLVRREDKGLATTLPTFTKPQPFDEQTYLQRQMSLSEAQALPEQERRQQRAQCVRTLTAGRNARRAQAAAPAPLPPLVIAPVTSSEVPPTMIEMHPALRASMMPNPTVDNFNNSSHTFNGSMAETTEASRMHLSPIRTADLGGLIRGHLRQPSEQSSVYPNSPRPFCPSTSEFNLLSPRGLSSSTSEFNLLSPVGRFSCTDSGSTTPVSAGPDTSGLGIAETSVETRLAAVPEIVRESIADDMEWQHGGRARAGTTETQYEREAFMAELAQRQKNVQESLRIKMENTRASSPSMSSWTGFERPFGILRGRSSRDTFTSKYESSLKPRNAVGLATKTSTSSFVAPAKPSPTDTKRFGLDGATSPIGKTLKTQLKAINNDSPPTSPELVLDGAMEMSRCGSENSDREQAQAGTSEPVNSQLVDSVRQQPNLQPLVTNFSTTPQQESFDSVSGMQSPTGSMPTLSDATSPSINSIYASPSQHAPPRSHILLSSGQQGKLQPQSEARQLHRKIHVLKAEISEPVLISQTYAYDTVDLPEGASLRNGLDGGVDMVLTARPALRTRESRIRLVGSPTGNVVE